MIRMPEGPPGIISIVGIDPGTETLGMGILFVDLLSMRVVSSEAFTFVGSKLAGKTNWIGEVHGDRQGRLRAHEENLLVMFNHYQPFLIACESPFYSQRRPQAFGALTEAIASIRRAVMRYDAWKDLRMIDPPTVKNAVGAKGNAAKELVLEALLALPELNYNGARSLAECDEHSIDGLAVAYCRYRQLLEDLCLQRN